MKQIVFNEKAIEFFNGEKEKALDDIAVTIIHKDTLEQKDKEIERLSKLKINRDKELLKLNDEIERLNNIINELKWKLNLAENILYDYLYKDKKITKELYDEFKGLKGDSSNESFRNIR